MKHSIKIPGLVLFALGATVALAADDVPVKLELTTQDDDLRAGGEVAFALRMFDGTEQSTVIVRGERLPDRTTTTYSVAPKPPYKWSDVKDWGIHARPHPGDGLALQPDHWKVYAVLRGLGTNCERNTDMLDACFGPRNAALYFEGDTTKWQPLDAVLGKCRSDSQCNNDNFCGTGGKRLARCAPTNAAADRHGCLRLPAPQSVCLANETCNEQQDRCIAQGCENPDADQDGHARIACGGDDCDDNDPNRFPGHAEVCDGNGHDEDCNLTTVGKRDVDGDGFIDAACWNADGPS